MVGESLTLLGMAVIAVAYAVFWAARLASVGRRGVAVGGALLLLAACFVIVGRENAGATDRFGLGLGSELIGALLALLLLRQSRDGHLIWAWWTWLVLAVPVALIVSVPYLEGDRSDAALSLGLDVVGAVVVFVAALGFDLGQLIQKLERGRAADGKA